MTSVGYGLYTPKTLGGKLVALLLGIFGALYMAMPLTIVGSNFFNAYDQYEEQKKSRKNRLRFRASVNKVIKWQRFKTKRAEFGLGAHVQVSQADGTQRDGVVTKVYDGKQSGMYTVQYEDNTIDEFVNHMLIRKREIITPTEVRTTLQVTIKVFKDYIQIKTPSSEELTQLLTESLLQFKVNTVYNSASKYRLSSRWLDLLC